MHKLKPIITAILMVLPVMAIQANAATVNSIPGSQVDVTSDPNANPAINFIGNDVVSVSTPVISGNIVGSGGSLDLNGTTTINGNVGSSAAPIAYVSPGLADSWTTSRLANNDVYTFNGNVYVNWLVVNNGPGTPYSSTVLFNNGDIVNLYTLDWRAPNASYVSSIDLNGNAVTAHAIYFDTSNGGLNRLISTITANGGQTGCTQGSNTAGCINATQNGQTFMGAMYTLPSSLQVAMRVANGVTLTNGTKYTIIDFPTGQTAVPALSNAITSLTNGYSFVQDTSNTQDLVIELTGIPVGGIVTATFRPLAGIPGANAAGELDVLSATATDPGMISAITSLQNMSVSDRTAALHRMAPETSRGIETSALNVAFQTFDGISTRLSGLRQDGFQTGMMDDLMSGKAKVATTGDMMGMFSGDESHKYGAWFKAFGQKDNQDPRSDYAGYSSSTAGVTIGADTQLANKWVVGATFTYADSHVSMQGFRSGDDSGIKTYQGAAYASTDYGLWCLDSMLAYAHQSYGASRDTGVTGVANGDFGGSLWSGMVKAGMPVAMSGNVKLTSYAGLDFNHLHHDSYTETGGGALGLQVSGASANRLATAVGAKLGTEIETSGSVKVFPSIDLAWRHNIVNDGVDTTASFIDGGSSFTTAGQTLSRDTATLAGIVALKKGNNFKATFQLGAEVGSGYVGYSGQAVVQLMF